MQGKKPVLIGRFVMFDAAISVWLDPGTLDGTVEWDWTESGYLKMTLPGACDTWHRLVKTTLHECLEAAIVLRRCQFTPAGALNMTYHAADSYMMVMRHHEFTEVTENAGDMLSALLPVLKADWIKMKRKGGVRKMAKSKKKAMPMKKKAKC